MDTKYATKQRRENLQILFNNTSVVPFKWRMRYQCYYCPHQEVEFKDFFRHTKSHVKLKSTDHPYKQLVSTKVIVKIDVSNLTCELCNESFKNLDDLTSHLVEKHKLKYDSAVNNYVEVYNLDEMRCPQCSERFKVFINLRSHVKNNHAPITLYCDQCTQKFYRKRDLAFHIKNAHHEDGYNCSVCSEKFLNNSKLGFHTKDKHITVCHICYERFQTPLLKRDHIKSAHKSQSCSRCFRTFISKLGLQKHTKKCTIKIEYPKQSGPVKTNTKQIRENIACLLNMSTALPFKYYMNRFRCFFCPKDFTDFVPLREHTLVNHPYCDVDERGLKLCRGKDINVKLDIAALSCKICLESFLELDALIDHLIVNHKTNYDKTIKGFIQPYKLVQDHMVCPICQTTFRYFGKLLAHMNEVHTDNNIICVYCGQTFRSQPNYRSHVSRYHKQENFKCPCGESFDNIMKLKTHKNKAHRAKTHKCQQCTECFETIYQRLRHMVTVHNVGHKCSFCGKVFTRNSFMNDHIRRAHYKEKNVECTVCGEKFFGNAHLKNHMVKHIGERNFHCDVCGKSFLWKKNLRGHMASHNKRALL